MTIAVAGNAILDLYKRVDTYPTPSSLTSIRSVTPAPGGLLCNCAMDLARLDPELTIPVVGVVGKDSEGASILEALNGYPNIDTSQVHLIGKTSFTDVMEDSTSGTRTFFQYRGANALLDLEHFDLEALGAELLHVGYALLLDSLDRPDPEYGTRLARLLNEAQTCGIRTSIDAVSEDSDRFTQIVPPALKYTDYCIINEIEASGITGLDLVGTDGLDLSMVRQAAGMLLEMGVSEWVVIHWREGAAGLSQSGEWVTRPSSNLDESRIVTRTGAGDAFASGVLYGAHKDYRLSEAIELGLGSAAGSLLAANATDGVGPAPDMLELYRSGELGDKVPVEG